MRGNAEKHQTRFYACFAVALGATMGIAFAANLFTLFVFYEVLTLCTYPLVTHKGDEAARRGGRVYLGVLLGTSIGLQLVAIVWTYALTGTLDFSAGGILAGKAEGPMVGLLLALYMFGIGKAALMPFHHWLPAAMVAPTPVSALLHAVAVVKAGVFCVVKVVVYVFGLELLRARLERDHGPGWVKWCAALLPLGDGFAEPMTEPVTEPVGEPVAEPMAEPMVAPVVKPMVVPAGVGAGVLAMSLKTVAILIAGVVAGTSAGYGSRGSPPRAGCVARGTAASSTVCTTAVSSSTGRC